MVFGILILVFVILSGERFSWLLWIGLPLLMIGLGYLFIVNTFESLWVYEMRVQDEKEKLEKERSLEHPPGQ